MSWPTVAAIGEEALRCCSAVEVAPLVGCLD